MHYNAIHADSAVMKDTKLMRYSILLHADPTPDFGPMPRSIYLYVTDCDRVYQRALDSGGTSVFPIMTLPSGERYGGVKDPCGNIWWVATHVEDIPPDEQERRWKEFKMPRTVREIRPKMQAAFWKNHCN